MNKIIKDTRKSEVKELLYVDYLVLLGDSWEEEEIRYARGKKLRQKKA